MSSDIRNKYNIQVKNGEKPQNVTIYIKRTKNKEPGPSRSRQPATCPEASSPVISVPKISVDDSTKGLMIILNNQRFKSHPVERSVGSGLFSEVKKLRKLAKIYNLRPVVIKEPKLDDIDKLVSQLSKYDFSTHSCLMFVALTYTNYGQLRAYDGYYNLRNKIMHRVLDKNSTLRRIQSFFLTNCVANYMDRNLPYEESKPLVHPCKNLFVLEMAYFNRETPNNTINELYDVMKDTEFVKGKSLAGIASVVNKNCWDKGIHFQSIDYSRNAQYFSFGELLD